MEVARGEHALGKGAHEGVGLEMKDEAFHPSASDQQDE
jgi:hypothetical protein